MDVTAVALWFLDEWFIPEIVNLTQIVFQNTRLKFWDYQRQPVSSSWMCAEEDSAEPGTSSSSSGAQFWGFSGSGGNKRGEGGSGGGGDDDDERMEEGGGGGGNAPEGEPPKYKAVDRQTLLERARRIVIRFFEGDEVGAHDELMVWRREVGSVVDTLPYGEIINQLIREGDTDAYRVRKVQERILFLILEMRDERHGFDLGPIAQGNLSNIQDVIDHEVRRGSRIRHLLSSPDQERDDVPQQKRWAPRPRL
ncbi:hypothetical protein B9Z55_021113 [Caenorhabditis nigoni]|uniref:Uncharacterized protein n=1 Tax=Caenorhabditis nigoni TaxID=1611254 RepID=A0A2G5TQQ5_9PELO|nr:hypothetical protein B9Z55_021113 [Caenorhabditis nigoni]